MTPLLACMRPFGRPWGSSVTRKLDRLVMICATGRKGECDDCVVGWQAPRTLLEFFEIPRASIVAIVIRQICKPLQFYLAHTVPVVVPRPGGLRPRVVHHLMAPPPGRGLGTGFG